MDAERIKEVRIEHKKIVDGEWGHLQAFEYNLVERVGELLDEIERLRSLADIRQADEHEAQAEGDRLTKILLESDYLAPRDELLKVCDD